MHSADVLWGRTPSPPLPYNIRFWSDQKSKFIFALNAICIWHPIHPLRWSYTSPTSQRPKTHYDLKYNMYICLKQLQFTRYAQVWVRLRHGFMHWGQQLDKGCAKVHVKEECPPNPTRSQVWVRLRNMTAWIHVADWLQLEARALPRKYRAWAQK